MGGLSFARAMTASCHPGQVVNRLARCMPLPAAIPPEANAPSAVRTPLRSRVCCGPLSFSRRLSSPPGKPSRDGAGGGRFSARRHAAGEAGKLHQWRRIGDTAAKAASAAGRGALRRRKARYSAACRWRCGRRRLGPRRGAWRSFAGSARPRPTGARMASTFQRGIMGRSRDCGRLPPDPEYHQIVGPISRRIFIIWHFPPVRWCAFPLRICNGKRVCRAVGPGGPGSARAAGGWRLTPASVAARDGPSPAARTRPEAAWPKKCHCI